MEQAVEAYAQVVGLLSQQCQRLLEVGHPERCARQDFPAILTCFAVCLGATW